MAELYIDIEELTLDEDQAKTLVEKIKTLVNGEHPKATVEINGDSEYDSEDEKESD